MSALSRRYISLMIATGALVLAASLAEWRQERLLQFTFCMIMVVLASQLKVALPGVPGTLSVNFVVSLMALTSFNLSQSVIVACAGSLAQCLWKSKSRPTPAQVAFNIATAVLSTRLAYAIYHAQSVRVLSDHPALLIFCASMVYFLTNTAAVATVIALTERKNPWVVWRDHFFWTAPQYVVGGFVAWLASLVSGSLGWEVSTLVLPTVLLVDRSYRLYLGRLEQEQAHVAQMADLHLRTIKALALAIDAKDETTNDHLRRVQVYATEIAKEMGLSEQEQQALQAAALLHDIGKLAVPEYILSKPGSLTPEEFERMKIHPIVGAEILDTVGFPYPVVPIVRSHHEKWDGKGYPDGLRGEQIPIGARILAAVDCLDALASDRHYRRALPLDEAMQRVAAESGASFEPRVVEILKRRYLELEQMAKAAPPIRSKLSTHLKVDRGDAPAAGFEEGRQSTLNEASSQDFVFSIASARQEIQTLLELTHGLGNSLSVADTFSLLASRLKEAIPHDALAIYIREGDKLIPEYVSGTDSGLFASLRIPLGQGLSGWVAEKQKPILNGNASVEPGYLNDAAKFSTLRAALSVPLSGMSGVIGCLTLYHREPNAFSRDHLRLLLAISSKCGIAIENALQFKQVQKSAVTDDLTGLPNARALFVALDKELARSKDSLSQLAVLVLDLDSFKQVNDEFGHIEGNRLLKLIAEGLDDLRRPSDYVARMGGDEFVMILRDIEPAAVDKRIALLREMAALQGRIVTGRDLVSLSVGKAFYPQDGLTAEEILAAADRRMYEMKCSRRRFHNRVSSVEETSPVQSLLAGYPKEPAIQSAAKASRP